MIRLSQIKGVEVGLASHISFRLPLERFYGFTMRFIEWAIFRPRCQLCMWIFHTEFKDDIQNGHQNFNFLIIHLKQLKLR